MPYKSEYLHIPLVGLQDRRRKLTDEQRFEIKKLYATGDYSLNTLAGLFGVSKKTVLLLVNPASAETAREYKRDNWQRWQRSTEEQTAATRAHRLYKHSLFLAGELGGDKD